MRWTAFSVILCGVCAGTAGAENVLVILTHDRAVYGKLAFDAEGRVAIVRRGVTVAVEPGEVRRRIVESRVDEEIAAQRAKLAARDIEGHLRLALLCLETERRALARELTAAAYQAFDGKPPPATGPAAAPVAPPPAVPPPASSSGLALWGPTDRPVLRIQVKKRIDGEEADDPVRWTRISRLLATARPPFRVLQHADAESRADYIVSVDVEARVTGQQKFFDEIPVSNEWQGSGVLRVIAAATEESALRIDSGAVKDSFSVNLKGGEMLADILLDALIAGMVREPAFRLKR